MSGLNNDFSQKTRYLFLYNNECWECGQNGIDAGHHIVGRESNSPLNFAPLHNARCHIGKSFSDEKTGYYLVRTWHFLTEKVGYVPDEKDLEFKAKHDRLYKLGYVYAEENLLTIL